MSKFSESTSIKIGIYGLILTLLFGVISIIAIFYEKKPGLTIEVTSIYNALDIRESVSGLRILYKDEDIRKSEKNIRIYKLRIINSGAVDINQNLFDVALPWGVSLKGGRILDVKPSWSSSQYLTEQMRQTKFNSNSITLPKPILERTMGMEYDILVLHELKSPISIEAKGKITGIPKLEVTYNLPNERDYSVWRQAFNGSALVQFLRILGYLIIAILLIVIVGLSIWGGSAILERMRKRRLKKRLLNLGFTTSQLQDSVILRGLINSGQPAIAKFSKLVNDEVALKEIITSHRLRKTALEEEKNQSPSKERIVFTYDMLDRDAEDMVEKLIDTKLIQVTGGKIVIDKSIPATLLKIESVT